MEAYLFVWNPKQGNPPSLSAVADKIRRKGRCSVNWRCGSRMNLPIGSRVFLIRLGAEPKGIVGSGQTLTEPADGVVRIAFDAAGDEPLIPFEVLQREPFVGFKWIIFGSGVRIPPEYANPLEALWRKQGITIGKLGKEAPAVAGGGKLHILVGENSSSGIIRGAGRNGRSVNWIVPKTATVGDKAAIYVPAEGFIGLARISTDPEPTTFGKKEAWGALVGGIVLFTTPVPLTAILSRFPSWKWATYPRSYATVSGELASQLAHFMLQDRRTTLSDPDPAQEGAAREARAIVRARSGRLRMEALQRAHGNCEVCRIDYSRWLDGLGVRVLQVHHLRQLSLATVPRLTGIRDLAVVCANCHALLHSDPKKSMAISELRSHLEAMNATQP